MTEADEKNLRSYLLTLCLAAKLGKDGDMREAVNDVVAAIKSMQNDEAELWKDRCAAAQQAHEATIKHFEDEARRDW